MPIRILFLVAALVGALVLPQVVQSALAAKIRYQDLVRRQELAIERQVRIDAFRTKVSGFETFAKEVESFFKIAESHPSLPKNWIPYEVDLSKTLIDVTDFRAILSRAKHGGDFYFEPDRLELHTGLSPELPTLLQGPVSAAKGTMAAGGTQGLTQDAIIGSYVLLSLKGRFWVYKRN
ncbi:MAG: hypothetical protein HQL82_10600 [Magnetococcales bacterium]|nr:hypothetical protein [Magnetococcales bacterium]